MITPKDISEAIRKNGYPQIQGMYVRLSDKGNILGACALGQAYLNLKGEDSAKDAYEDADDIASILDRVGRIFCPANEPDESVHHNEGANLGSMVIHLNDDHEWTTTEIADWLDTVIGDK